MNNKPISNPYKPTTNIFRRYNLTLFVVVIVGGLIFCILMLTNIMNRPPDDSANTSNGRTTQFDQATIDSLNKYKASSDNLGTQVLPSGRINPFSE